MFRVTNIRKISRISEIGTHHTAETSPTLREDSVVEIQKNSDVTFNYFFFRFSKRTEN